MLGTKDEVFAVRRYYFPIINNGQLQAGDAGEMFESADLAMQYGARVARDIGSDPEYDPVNSTVVMVVDGAGTEIARHLISERGN